MKIDRWLIMALVLMLAMSSCTYVRKPKLNADEQSKLLDYLRYSPLEDVRSSAAMVLLLFDHAKYTSTVAKQLEREKQDWMKLRLMSLLAQWGDEQAIPYLEPYSKREDKVSTFSGDKICMKDAAREVIKALKTPRPPRNLPRQVTIW